MSNTAVEIHNVSKRFRLYHEKYTSLKERIIHAGRIPYEDLWALRDVAFEVKEGETVGILGRNGSGKSTLLKCVCGVLHPTAGEVRVRGKLAGLLELGAGFQPDLTGRENIYLNGSMLGMSKREVDRVFDDVVDFAELGQFIDNQVKFYSSGMYVRLGFAVAVNVDPDVLVIDEVLAVGDERFQRKCMERVKWFQEQGRTILFVSHSPDQVRAICDRAVVLADGHMMAVGPPGEAVRLFREGLLEAGSELRGIETEVPEAEAANGAAEAPVAIHEPGPSKHDVSRPVRLTEVVATYADSDNRHYVLQGEALTVRVNYQASVPTPGVVFTIEVRDESAIMLFHTDTEVLGFRHDVPAGPGAIDFHFPSVPLFDGTFDVNVGIMSERGGLQFDYQEPACRFEVMNPGRSTGMVALAVSVSAVPAEALVGS